MTEETRKVLEMLSSGKVTVQEAEQLLQAVGAPGTTAGATADEKALPAGARMPRASSASAARGCE